MFVFRSPEGFRSTDQPDPGAVTRITRADSPYTTLIGDHNLYCNTTDGPIVVNLLAGQPGKGYRIINTGIVANDVTINPNGTELLLGANSSIVVMDGDVVIVVFQAIEGWW